LSITAHSLVQVPRSSVPKRWLWPILFSVLVHILLLIVANREMPIKPMAKKPEPSIQSYLYTPARSRILDIEPAQQQSSKQATTETQPEVQHTQTLALVPEPEKNQTITPIPQTEEQIITTDNQTVSDITSNSPQINGMGYRLSNQLQQLQQSQYQDMLNKQTQSYRQEWAQEVVRPSTVPKLTAEQELQKTRQIVANCDKGLNNTLAFLSGLTGGTVKCSKNAAFKGFIQRRLNKQQQ